MMLPAAADEGAVWGTVDIVAPAHGMIPYTVSNDAYTVSSN